MNDERDLLQTALRDAGVGIWRWDVHDDQVTWDEQLCRIFDRPTGPDTFEGYLAYVHPDDRDEVVQIIEGTLARAAAEGTPGSYYVEHRIVRPNGGVRWIEARGRAEADANGQPVRMSGTALDCTARKDAEEALRQREETFRLYTDLASDYVYIVDMRHAALVPRVVAGSFERTTGLTVEEVAERGGWAACMHPDDQAEVDGVMGSLMEGQPLVVEYRVVTRDGEERWLRDRIRPVQNADGQTVRIHGAVQDVTESKRLEEQLMSARKHEALARLSGGVAHDFNNLLTVIIGSTGMLQCRDMTEEQAESIRVIEESVRHAAALTRSLLLFAGRSPSAPSVVAVDDLLEQVRPMLAKALGPRRLAVEGRLPGSFVRIDPSEAQLMLLNLAMNARHASKTGSTVTLRAEVVSAEDCPTGSATEPHVALSVSDEGVGIPAELLPRLFEPYFTTRPPGEGTGLGLAACQGIASRAGGRILARSNPGEGATFTSTCRACPSPRRRGRRPGASSRSRRGARSACWSSTTSRTSGGSSSSPFARSATT